MGDKEYIRDDRLEEFRATDELWQRISFEEIRQTYLTLRTNVECLFRGGRETNAEELSIVAMGNKEYFRDDKLREFRAVDNPHDCVSFKQVRQVYLEAIAKIEDLFKARPEQF